MSKQMISSMSLKEQKAIKPKVEDVITEVLDKDMKKTALDFITYMRENKMKPTWYLVNKWKSSYKGKPICNIRISMCDKNGYHRGYYNPANCLPAWVIGLNLTHMDTYKESIMNEDLQDMIWNNAFHCVYSSQSPSPGIGCSPGKSCVPGGKVTILSKEITNLCCGYYAMSIWNPDETAISRIKRLLELERQARTDKSR